MDRLWQGVRQRGALGLRAQVDQVIAGVGQRVAILARLRALADDAGLDPEFAEKFINFMQDPEIAAANFEYLNYATPNQVAYDDYIDEDAKKNEFIFPSDEYLDKCYVFSNVSDEVYSYMQEQFVKIQAD